MDSPNLTQTSERTPDGKFKKGFPHNRGHKQSPDHIENNRLARIGKTQSPETIKKRIRWGEEHQGWKGDEVGYYALHAWIKRKYGKPDRCDNLDCTFINPKRYEWANISGEYKRDRDDWLQLCPSCHRKRDNKVRRVLQLSLDGQLVTVFKSAQEAADILGVKRASIASVCAGRQKSAYGYKWQWLQP